MGNGTPRTIATSYFANGQVEGHVLPSGAVVRYTYRADGRMFTLRVNGVEIVRSIDYHAFGEPESWDYGSSDHYQRTVDLDGRVEKHTAGSSVRTLHYDPASRIDAQTDSAGGPNQWAYDYDDLDRLESATNAGTQGAIANLALGWDYDPTGNRISETRGVNPPVPYAIEPISNKLASVNAVTRAYDEAGNTLNDGAGLTSIYNARNRLIRTNKSGLTTHYAHNAFGERVCKGSAGPSCVQSPDRSEYVYDDDGHLIGEYAPNLADHTEILWLDDTPIALLKRRPGSSDGGPGGGGTPTAWAGMAAGGVDVYFIQPDHLDTPRVLVNAANAPVWRWDSAPFGETAANEQPTAGISNFTFNLRFPGQQYDRETQTHYNYFRDYEVQTGRYVQSDPVGIALDIATFRYGDRNPISFSDPFGLGLIVRNSAGAIVYRDKSFPLPCATGTSHAKGLAGEAAMAAVASSGVVPGLSGKLGLGVTIPPPPGMTGNSITDGSMGSIGLEAKCGPCAKPTKNQKQNKGNMAAAGLTDIFTFRFRK